MSFYTASTTTAAMKESSPFRTDYEGDKNNFEERRPPASAAMTDKPPARMIGHWQRRDYQMTISGHLYRLSRATGF